MITMTINEALMIQAHHVEHYGSLYPGGEDALRAAVEAQTHIPPGLPRDSQVPVFLINQMIPRGATIAYMCGLDLGGD